MGEGVAANSSSGHVNNNGLFTGRAGNEHQES